MQCFWQRPSDLPAADGSRLTESSARFHARTGRTLRQPHGAESELRQHRLEALRQNWRGRVGSDSPAGVYSTLIACPRALGFDEPFDARIQQRAQPFEKLEPGGVEMSARRFGRTQSPQQVAQERAGALAQTGRMLSGWRLVLVFILFPEVPLPACRPRAWPGPATVQPLSWAGRCAGARCRLRPPVLHLS